MSISSTSKSIQDIMRKDGGLDGDALNQLGAKGAGRLHRRQPAVRRHARWSSRR